MTKFIEVYYEDTTVGKHRHLRFELPKNILGVNAIYLTEEQPTESKKIFPKVDNNEQ